MKIYHKILLYQNKWLYPYIRILLTGMVYVACLASLLLIWGVVYEHGFMVSERSAGWLQYLYDIVRGIFLLEVTLYILLDYQNTKRRFNRLTWVLTALYIERLYFLFVTYLIISRYRKTQT